MKLQVYYDGLCPLCSREISLYRRRAASEGVEGRLDFVDIMAPGFVAAKFGLDPVEVQKLFHVRTESGALLSGVGAFAEIWKVIPGFGVPLWLYQHQPSRAVMDLGYILFAKARPFLPRKKSCDDGNCKI
jgi:predicted DCC family thiol-disulfide oxidoreductase YuxK